MELLNQEILKNLLQFKKPLEAVKATVEMELNQWIEKDGHVNFFCTNQKQVKFTPMASYDLDDDCVILCDDVAGSKRIDFEEIRKLFQLYFDRVTEKTRQKFDVKVDGSVNGSFILVEKVDHVNPEEVSMKKGPSRSPKTKTRN